MQLVQNRLIVTTSLSIPCGSDTSLYVFERSSGDWRRTLEFESNGYKSIAGARGSFDWKIGGGNVSTPWFLVAADVNPWCTSNWQQLRWVVLRPGKQADRPDVVHKGNEYIYLARDEPYRVTAYQEGFRLVWWGDEPLDVSLLVRHHIANFKVTGHTVQRVPPVAFRADDFIDEWAQAPWREAAKWTRAAARSSARRWHALLSKSSADAGYITAFKDVQACTQQITWQVGLGFETLAGSQRLPAGIPERLFFLVGQLGSRFELMNVGTTAFAGCAGTTPPSPGPENLPREPNYK